MIKPIVKDVLFLGQKSENATKNDNDLFGIKDFSINSLTNLNIRKLKKIKDKYKNIKIYISVDKNMFNKDLDKLTKFLINVDNLNLDGIFFYDLGINYY